MKHWILALLCFANTYGGSGKDKAPPVSAIDQLIAESAARESHASPGSTYESDGRYGELVRDLRAGQKGDIVTIVVSERASAVTKGTTASNRAGSANAKVTAFAGPLPAMGAMSNLASAQSKWDLQGQGETTRETSLSTRLSARVIHVLPNGNLIVEGSKDVTVNSERQKVTVRGVIRWNDLSQFNTVASDRISDLEVRIDGKGVVQDAIRRPNILYRILLGILPF
jgi:flagellar L-ring protein precursor FlgH